MLNQLFRIAAWTLLGLMWLAYAGKTAIAVSVMWSQVPQGTEDFYDRCVWLLFSAAGALALLATTYLVRNLFNRE